MPCNYPVIECIASAILSMLEGTYIWNEKIVLKPEMPISLKEAYYEYHYGIFAGC